VRTSTSVCGQVSSPTFSEVNIVALALIDRTQVHNELRTVGSHGTESREFLLKRASSWLMLACLIHI